MNLKTSLFIAISCFLLSGAGTTVAFAKAPPHKAPPPRFRPFVISVGADSVTVEVAEHAAAKITDVDDSGNRNSEAPSNIVTFQVGPDTQIVVNDLPGKLSDVQPGMKVEVTAGMNRTSAALLVAHSVPPSPRAKKAKTRSMFQKISRDVVIAITDDRITYGASHTEKAHAAYITPQTAIYVAGQRSSVSDITVGMSVDVATGDGQHATSIRAGETDDADGQ